MDFDIVPSWRVNVTVSNSDLEKNPNLYYDGSDIAWMMISSALVFLMVPGVALFNSGYSPRTSALTLLLLPLLTATVLALQWWLWGYAITFTASGNEFWGSYHAFSFHSVKINPSGIDHGRKIPELLFALYQCMFAIFTGALVSGTVANKGRFVPFLIFIVIWSTFIYDPIARWSWYSGGWSHKWGSLDFAGGTVVHICAATTAAVYSVFFRLRARVFRNRGFKAEAVELRELSQCPNPTREDQEETDPRPRQNPHNIVNVVIGTVFLWVGWFGFNGGSALGANIRAVSACTSTFLAACAGGLSWNFFDWSSITLVRAWTRFKQTRNGGRSQLEHEGKFSVVGFCNGVVAGLVAITPAAGYVSCRISPLFGIVAAGVCYVFMTGDIISDFLLDSLNIFVIHAIGGLVGMVMTGIFAQSSVADLDGYTQIPGGWLDGNWKQIGIQIADALAGMAYAGIGTLVILCIMEAVTFMVTRQPMEDGHRVLDEDDIVQKEL